MNNREKAADVIRTWQARHKTEMDTNPAWAAQNLAGDLAAAGRLAPDLPPLRSNYDSIEVPVLSTIINMHDDPERYDDDSILVGTWFGEVEFSLGKFDEVSVYMSTDQARQFANALYAAADYSEGNRE